MFVHDHKAGDSAAAQRGVLHAMRTSARSRDLRLGVIERHRHNAQRKLSYYLYVPSGGGKDAPVLVSVHGISRKAGQHAKQFAALAERYGMVLIAPRFKRQRFPNYQKLGLTRNSRESRADHALHAILAEVTELTGARTEQVYLFGYSGGGQFVHRYAMAYPAKVKAVAMGAPGWYTFPSEQKLYPRGLNCEQLQFDPQWFLQVPMAVFVGAQDDQRDTALNASARVDRQQGQTRIERGRRWIKAMRKTACRYGYPTPYEFHLLSGCGHSFKRCMEQEQMGLQVLQFFFRVSQDTRSKTNISSAGG